MHSSDEAKDRVEASKTIEAAEFIGHGRNLLFAQPQQLNYAFRIVIISDASKNNQNKQISRVSCGMVLDGANWNQMLVGLGIKLFAASTCQHCLLSAAKCQMCALWTN